MSLAHSLESKADQLGLIGKVLKYVKIGTIIVDVGAKFASGQQIEGLVELTSEIVRTGSALVATPYLTSVGASAGFAFGTAVPVIGNAIGLVSGAIVGFGVGAIGVPTACGYFYDVWLRDQIIGLATAAWGEGA
jgi:hypothetical protein